MQSQSPSSIGQLMSHLSRKYSLATLDSPRADLDTWELPLQQSGFSHHSKLQPISKICYSEANNKACSEAYNHFEAQKPLRTHQRKPYGLSITPFKNSGIVKTKPQQILDFQSPKESRGISSPKLYAHDLELINRSLKQELLEVRELLREQAEVIEELYYEHQH